MGKIGILCKRAKCYLCLDCIVNENFNVFMSFLNELPIRKPEQIAEIFIK